MGQGERVFHPGPDGRTTRLGSPDAEHDCAGELLLLAGDTATRLLLGDAVRSLDVLASHPDVDPRRLASVGHSGGGTLTMLLAAVDARVSVAAISCANTENVATRDFEPPGSVDDAEQNLPGSGPLGLDRWDLLYPLAPKPLLVLVSTEDPGTTYSPGYLASGREEVARLRRVYATLGRPDHLRWVESAEPHALTGARRGEIERWLARFLLGESARRAEPAVAPEPEPATWVVPGGNVRAMGGRTPRELASEQVAARKAARPAMLEVTRPAAGLSASELGRAPATGGAVTAIEVRSTPSVWVPAWLFEPPGPRGAVVIALDPRGRGARWEDSEWAGHGEAVCAADVRGTGSLAVPGAEQAFAAAALILGESLLEQRVADILALVTALSNHPRVGGRPLVLAARGALTVPALFAAALEPRISAVHLDAGLASFASVLSAPEGTVSARGNRPRHRRSRRSPRGRRGGEPTEGARHTPGGRRGPAPRAGGGARHLPRRAERDRRDYWMSALMAGFGCLSAVKRPQWASSPAPVGSFQFSSNASNQKARTSFSLAHEVSCP